MISRSDEKEQALGPTCVIDLMTVCDWVYASVSEWERCLSRRTKASWARERERQRERETETETEREKEKDSLIIPFCKGGTCHGNLPLFVEDLAGPLLTD